MSCPTNKKAHATEADAIQFDIRNREAHPESERQYPYLCEDCGAHHLTAMPTGDKTRARVNFDEAAKFNVSKPRRTVEENLELQRQVIALTHRGLSAKAIAEQLGISEPTVYSLRGGKIGGLSGTIEGIEAKQLSLQEQIAALQAQVKQEEERKKMIIELRQLRVQWNEDENGERTLLITHDQNRFVLLKEDGPKLVQLLQQRLAELKVAAD